LSWCCVHQWYHSVSVENHQFYFQKRKGTTLVAHNVVTLSFLDIKL